MKPSIAILKRAPYIGTTIAKRIIDTFQDDLPDVLTDETKFLDVATVIGGKSGPTTFNRKVTSELYSIWQSRLAPEFSATRWLEENGIAEPRLAIKIAKLLGKKTETVLSSNPYSLSRALPWATVDNVAQKIYGTSFSTNMDNRLIGAFNSVMSSLLADGHTAMAKKRVIGKIKSKIACEWSIADKAVNLAVEKRYGILDGNIIRSPGSAWMEKEISERFARMPTERSSAAPSEDQILDITRKWAADQQPTPPSDEQLESIRHALRSQLSVITGGAGTGKTTTMRGVVECWEQMRGRVQLCTLSGKAALRLSKSTSRLARTIHRTLKEIKLQDEFEAKGGRVKEELAYLDSRTLLIIDEASMVDLGMMCKIVHNMPEGCRLLLVGDTAQLPPIGPGIVFHEMAAEPNITRELTKVFRQAEGSGIPAVSKDIKHQTMPNMDTFQGPAEGVSFIPCDVHEIPDRVEQVVDALGGFNINGHDTQILAALNRTCQTLNTRFHAANAHGKSEMNGFWGTRFSIGDPVVFLANDYKRALFNGMLGHVKKINKSKKILLSVFDGDEHTFPIADIINVDLAYCLSGHKLQGSEADRVIVVVEPTRLMEPSWLYTAVTRAKKQCIIIGPEKMLEDSLARDPAWTKRVHGFKLK